MRGHLCAWPCILRAQLAPQTTQTRGCSQGNLVDVPPSRVEAGAPNTPLQLRPSAHCGGGLPARVPGGAHRACAAEFIPPHAVMPPLLKTPQYPRGVHQVEWESSHKECLRCFLCSHKILKHCLPPGLSGQGIAIVPREGGYWAQSVVAELC